MGEVEILRRLQGHPNILSLNAVYESAKEISIVTEYIEGRDIEQLIKQEGAITEVKALNII